MFAGLELTFANNWTKEHIVEEKVSGQTVEEINEYLGGLRKKFSCGSDLVEGKQKDFGGASQHAKNLRVDVATEETQREPPEGFTRNTWSFNVSIDPQVIEVQTDPTWWGDDGPEDPKVYSAYDDIFDTIQKLPLHGQQLTPTRGVGGGHVNVDAKTAEIRTPQHVLEMMLMWEDRRKQFMDLIEESDQCQAVVRATRYKELFTKGNRDTANTNELQTLLFGLKEKQWKDWETAKEAITDAFFQYPQISLINENAPGCLPFKKYNDNDKDRPRARQTVLHNQAINIEWLKNDGLAVKGRIEFREFGAQKDVDDVIRCVKACRDFITKCKS